MAVATKTGPTTGVKVALMTTGTPGVTVTPVARPVFNPTEASAELVPLVDQAEVVVLSWNVPSLNSSIAANCWVPPTGVEAVRGVTLNDTDFAAVTVKVAGVAIWAPKVAVMVDVPVATPVARPLVGEPERLSIVATAGVPVPQMEAAVLLKVVPSLNVSIASYCCVPETGTEAVAGDTTNDTDVAAFTIKLAVAGECGLAAKVAVMTTVPDVTPVARPVCNPMVAWALLDAQVEVTVLSKVDPSLNVSIAVYCWIPVTGIEAVAGVTLNETDVAPFTVNVDDEPELPSKVAVMTDDVPLTRPVARPVAAPTEALAGVSELQAEDAVTSMDDPSLYIAFASNCWLPVTGTEAVTGVTLMDIKWRAGDQCPV